MTHTVQNILQEIDIQLQENTCMSRWIGRTVRGISIAAGDSCIKKTAAFSVATFAGIVTTAAIATSGWGSGLLLRDAVAAWSSNEKTPSTIGHGGEWSAQIFIYTFLLIQMADSLAKESDYVFVKKLFARKVGSLSSDKKEEVQIFYQHLLHYLHHYGSANFCKKDTLTVTSTAIRILRPVSLPRNSNKLMNVDRSLENIIFALKSDLDSNLGFRNITKRFSFGLSAIEKHHGKLGQTAALTRGVVIPVFFCLQSIFSFLGAWLVMDEVLKGESEVSLIGHVGEWPANGLFFAYMMFQLFYWSITSEGDLVIAKKICVQHLRELYEQAEESRFDTLRFIRFHGICNDFLKEVAENTHLGKNPGLYLIQKREIQKKKRTSFTIEISNE